MLLFGAETHHPLDVGAVVPTPVEEDDLPTRRQVLHVALEVPLCLLPLGGLGEGDHPHLAWAGPFGDPLDHAAFSGRSASLEDDQDFHPGLGDPVLELDQLLLHPGQLGLVDLLLQSTALVVVLCTSGRARTSLVVDSDR
jgi:hypothetical protein